MTFQIATWSIHPLLLLMLIAASLLYVRGWLQLRGKQPQLLGRSKLTAFLLANLLIGTVFLSPLAYWSDYLLSARALQQVLLTMLAPLLVWLACPVHVMTAGLPVAARRRASRLLFTGPVRPVRLSVLGSPLLAVAFFVGGTLLWHDPKIVNVVMARDGLQALALWLLLMAALLFWWHVVGRGPRRLAVYSSWAAAAYLLVAEIPNMLAGVSIAFHATPLYAYYWDVRMTGPALPLTVVEDQMVAGAIIWVIGSIVYVFGIVLSVNHIFKREGADAPIPRYTWDIDKKFIAPGLEHRLEQPDYVQVNWGED